MPPFSDAGPARYDFLAPSSILFGAGRLAELGEVAARFGREAWLVTGSRSLETCGGEAAVAAVLRAAGLDVTRVGTCTREPTACLCPPPYMSDILFILSTHIFYATPEGRTML